MENGFTFDETPEIMDKLIDNMWIGTNTAFHKETEEKFNLWEPYPNRHPSEPLTPPNTYKDVVYDGRPDEDADVTLIANYPTMVVTTNLGKA
jgi:hypothetical protein